MVLPREKYMKSIHQIRLVCLKVLRETSSITADSKQWLLTVWFKLQLLNPCLGHAALYTWDY